MHCHQMSPNHEHEITFLVQYVLLCPLSVLNATVLLIPKTGWRIFCHRQNRKLHIPHHALVLPLHSYPAHRERHKLIHRAVCISQRSMQAPPVSPHSIRRYPQSSVSPCISKGEKTGIYSGKARGKQVNRSIPLSLTTDTTNLHCHLQIISNMIDTAIRSVWGNCMQFQQVSSYREQANVSTGFGIIFLCTLSTLNATILYTTETVWRIPHHHQRPKRLLVLWYFAGMRAFPFRR